MRHAGVDGVRSRLARRVDACWHDTVWFTKDARTLFGGAVMPLNPLHYVRVVAVLFTHKDLCCIVSGAVAATPAGARHGLLCALPALAGGQHCMA
jgi:hypothetical protein